MDAKIEINGSVSHSVIIAAGGNVLFSRDVRAAVPHNRILVSCFDWELRSVSSGRVAKSYRTAYEAATLQTRILLTVAPSEATLVIPPSYYCESDLSRSVLLKHMHAIESGKIQLIADEEDLDEYLLRKQHRYQKARKFDRYQSAYFSPLYYPLARIGFIHTQKETSVGRLGLARWSQALMSADLQAPQLMLNELKQRAFETEQGAFLWENLREHIDAAGLSASSGIASRIRALKSKAYLGAYLENKIEVPVGSLLVSDDVVPDRSASAYNVRSWSELMSILGLIPKLVSLSTEAIAAIKKRREVAEPIELARRLFAAGWAADNVYGILHRRRLTEGLTKGFAL